MFVGTCYYHGADAGAQFFDDIAAGIKSEQHAQEDSIIDAMELTRAAHERQTAIYQDIQNIFEAQQSLMDSIVVAKSRELAHVMRAQVVAKLDTVVAEEARFTQSIQGGLVDAATAKVRTAVADEKVKTAALEQAFAAIADPTAPAGADPVSAVYSQVFSDFNAKLQAAAGEAQTLSAEAKAQMLEEMKSVARRDGLEFVDMNVPDTLALGKI